MIVSTAETDKLPSNPNVLIIGAGMVGATAALGLVQLGYSVMLVDAFAIKEGSKDTFTPSYDARSTAISWGSRDILAELGIWSDVQQHACPIQTVHVSQKGRFGVTKMYATEFDHEALGYVVPNQWLGQNLLSKLAEHDVCVASPCNVESIVRCSSSQHAELENPHSESYHSVSLRFGDGSDFQVATELVLIADGALSKTAAKLGIEYSVESYDQHAIIANVTTELSNEGVAYERFTSAGPLALLPLNRHDAALVWTQANNCVDAIMNLSDQAFCVQLNKQFGERLGRIVKVGERQCYPLKLSRAKEQHRPGVVLLGNAAHSLHPVAGQGFNLALRTVAAFLECMSEQARLPGGDSDGRVCNKLNTLHEARKFDQLKTIGFSDYVVKAFGHDSMLMSLSRDLGMIGLNNMPVLKRMFARSAMGTAQRRAELGIMSDR